MYINMSNSIKNSFFNIYSLNNQNFIQKQSIAKNIESQKQQDFLSISPLGKAKGIIESLMKQKQEITERKHELIGRTLEKGEDMQSIKSQLESFEEQIKHIDDQIAKTMAEQIKQQTETFKKVEYDKPQTEQETQTEHLNSIISLSSSLSQAQVVSSVKTKIDGEARVLATEIKLDESRGGVFTFKKERLADLQTQSDKLATEINEKLTKANEEIRNSASKQLIENENEDKNYDKPMDDELEP